MGQISGHRNRVLIKARDEPIPKLSSNSGDSKTPRLLLNSTKPKDYARNAREERKCGVRVCSHSLLPPYIYSREPQVTSYHSSANRRCEPMRRRHVASSRWWGPWAGRPTRLVGRPASGANRHQFPLVGCHGLPCLVHAGLGRS